MKCIAILLLLSSFFCFSAKGQDTVSNYGPTTMVRNVRKSKDGSILIAASFSGVLRYDGRTFTNLTSKLGARRVWDVMEDRSGDLWIATSDSGLYRYKGKSFEHFTSRDGLSSNGVMSIYEDKAGIIWIGTGAGISRYDGKSFQNLTTKAGRPNNDITTIIQDKAGKFWIGTRGEAFVYDGNTFTTLSHEGVAFKNIWSILEDQNGHIWLGGNEGLWRYDGSTFTQAAKKGATAMIQDHNGNIWTTGIVNPPGGKVWALSRYDYKSLYTRKPKSTEIMSIDGPGMLCGILEANDGSIWFGALGSTSGVFRYDGNTVTDFSNKAVHR